MNRFYLMSLAIAALTMAAPAMAALNVVNTSAPQVNYVFSTDGSVTVTDMASPLLNGGFLQSRIFQGEAGSPAAGKWVYEYRLDLRCAMSGDGGRPRHDRPVVGELVRRLLRLQLQRAGVVRDERLQRRHELLPGATPRCIRRRW